MSNSLDIISAELTAIVGPGKEDAVNSFCQRLMEIVNEEIYAVVDDAVETLREDILATIAFENTNRAAEISEIKSAMASRTVVTRPKINIPVAAPKPASNTESRAEIERRLRETNPIFKRADDRSKEKTMSQKLAGVQADFEARWVDKPTIDDKYYDDAADWASIRGDILKTMNEDAATAPVTPVNISASGGTGCSVVNKDGVSSFITALGDDYDDDGDQWDKLLRQKLGM